MAEYIEREDAIAWFMPYAHVGESIDADVVISDIKGMKAADVAPVRHGRWEVNELGYLVCTHCGWVRYGIPLVEHYPYCPSCGCSMDG